LFSEAAFIVVVNNVNEAVLSVALTGSSVNENAAINTTVGTFSSTDTDTGNTHSYTLVAGTGSDDNASFNISGSTLRTSRRFRLRDEEQLQHPRAQHRPGRLVHRGRVHHHGE